MKNLSFIIILLILASCNKSRLDIDVSHLDVSLEINRFEKVVFESDSVQLRVKLEQLYTLYPDFIDLYTQDIIRVGQLYDENFDVNFKKFYADTVIAQVADTVLKVFNDFSTIENEMVQGFKHLNYYFPGNSIPVIYTYVSGFNQSLVLAENFTGINLDKYLGSDCVFYQYLGIPQYKIKNMYPGKIVADLFYAYALTEFPNLDPVDNLLSNIIYQGKLMYFTEAMLPDTPDSVIVGYTALQMEWCEKNESLMWAHWAENKLLYSVERLDLQKYIGDAPFTSTFTNESPGKTGVWVGWQIIRSFMENHPDVSLSQLMEMNNGQEILSQSRYFPD